MKHMTICLAAAAAICASGASALTLSNTSNTMICCWSEGQKYGQTFAAPAGATSLDAIEFFIEDFGAPIDFTAYIFKWDQPTVRAVGASLGAVAGSTAGMSGLVSMEVSGLAASVTPGDDYIAFLLHSGGSTSGRWSYNTNGSSFPGGQFFFQNATGLANVTAASWDGSFQGDLAFTFTFNAGDTGPGGTVVPLPAAAPLLALGLGGLVALRRRRRA